MADTAPNTAADLIRVITEVLAEAGPMTEEQLGAAIRDRGVDLGDAGGEAADEVLGDLLDGNDGQLVVLTDGRWASLPALLVGRVFTHRVTGPEVEHDVLNVDPDLHPVVALIHEEPYQRLADGSPVSHVLAFDDDVLAGRGIPPGMVDAHGVVLLEPGYLRGKGCGDGDLITLGLTRDGLRVQVVTEQAVTDEPVDELGRLLEAVLAQQPDEPASLDAAVWTVCADDPVRFTEPMPPLGAALEACGLAHDGEWLARSGFDFPRWRAQQWRAEIAWRYGLGDDEAFAVVAIVLLYRRVARVYDAALTVHEQGADAARAAFEAELVAIPTPSSDGRSGDRDGVATLRDAVACMVQPAVAEAVLAEAMDADGEHLAALKLFAETLEPMAPRAARPALLWLRGRVCEELGDVFTAEASYQAAESVDPHWSPTLFALARYASDRSDASRGLALLRRAGTSHDHPLAELLERFEAAPRSDLGRNEQCWCGSGRKYKKCHLHREQLPLEERATWLYQKATLFLLGSPQRTVVVEAAEALAQFADGPHVLLDALTNPIVADAALFEGGVFADFVATRGALLPDDERQLAEQWLRTDRSVYEIEQLRQGEGFLARDVRTGDVHEVRQRSASRTLKVGGLVCARIVPAGGSTQVFGGIEPVPPHQRDELIALLDSGPDPNELLSFLSRRSAEPALDVVSVGSGA